MAVQVQATAYESSDDCDADPTNDCTISLALKRIDGEGNPGDVVARSPGFGAGQITGEYMAPPLISFALSGDDALLQAYTAAVTDPAASNKPTMSLWLETWVHEGQNQCVFLNSATMKLAYASA